MRRVARLAANIGVFLFAIALAAEAQPVPKVYRIGMLEMYRSPSFDSFVQGLREVGYFEGRNIVIEYRSAGVTATDSQSSRKIWRSAR